MHKLPIQGPLHQSERKQDDPGQLGVRGGPGSLPGAIYREQGLLLRINRTIQSEGAFGVLKEDRHFRRLRRRGQQGVFAEILLYAIAFDIEKLHAKERSGRLKTMLFYPDSA